MIYREGAYSEWKLFSLGLLFELVFWEIFFFCHVDFIHGIQYMCIIPFCTLLLFKTGWPNPEEELGRGRRKCRGRQSNAGFSQEPSGPSQQA